MVLEVSSVTSGTFNLVPSTQLQTHSALEHSSAIQTHLALLATRTFHTIPVQSGTTVAVPWYSRPLMHHSTPEVGQQAASNYLQLPKWQAVVEVAR
jgi:hypothetical protein